MKIEAFTHLAGSSYGTWTDYETTKAMVDIAIKVSGHPATLNLRQELETLGEDDISGAYFEIQQEASEYIQDYVEDYCAVSLDDNEWRVTPYVDDELPTFDDYQDDYQGDHILIVSDHGNVTCQRWDYDKAEYVTIWDMV